MEKIIDYLAEEERQQAERQELLAQQSREWLRTIECKPMNLDFLAMGD